MTTGEAGTPVYIRCLLALAQKSSTTSSLATEVVTVAVVVMIGVSLIDEMVIEEVS